MYSHIIIEHTMGIIIPVQNSKRFADAEILISEISACG